MEQPDAAEGHRDVVLVAGVNDLLVADGAAGLDDGRHPGTACALGVVAEGDECALAEATAGQLALVHLPFPSGHRPGATG